MEMPDSAWPFSLIAIAIQGTLDFEARMSVATPRLAALTKEQKKVIGYLDLLRALVSMVAFDLVLSMGGFGKLYRIVKGWPVRLVPTKSERVREVCDAVDRACTIYPKHALCLQRSAVAACLLRREGFGARMIIGCRKLPFIGHAWVEIDEKVVNDGALVKHLYAQLDQC